MKFLRQLAQHWLPAVIGLLGSIITIAPFAAGVWRLLQPHLVIYASLIFGAALIGLCVGLLLANHQGQEQTQDTVRILRNNLAMGKEVQKLMKDRPSSIQRAVVIQYSGTNVTETIQELWENTNADIELYLVHPDCAITPRQKRRIEVNREHLIDGGLGQHAHGPGTLTVFHYKSKGSLRVVWIRDRMLFVGAYSYQARRLTGAPDQLDSRGHDQPVVAIPFGNPAYALFAQAIDQMIENWREFNLLEQYRDPVKRKQ